MESNTVDGSNSDYSDACDDMEYNHSLHEDASQQYMLYRGKPYKDLTFDDLRNVEFSTIADVDQFYSYYSLAKGFSLRKHRCDKNRSGTVVLCRQLVCSKQGLRKGSGTREDDDEEQLVKGRDVISTNCGKEQKDSFSQSSPGYKRPSGDNTKPKPLKQTRRLTRGNCPASFTVRLCKARGVYYASEFTTDHNHELTQPEHRHFMRSHRKVKDSDIAAVTAMRKVSVRTSCAYEFLVHAAGGHEFVGFTIKDLYNKLKDARAEILLDGDAQACVTWMNMKAMRDPQFYCIFSVDDCGRLANMFWRDGTSLIDYNSFGKLLIFDSTYKSNIYGKPLAVLVGCNNHRATVLFGCALLVDETEETYLWLLTSFLTSMYGKKPCSVVTDGDEAMRNAVCRLLPEARHRICSWHIGKNVCSNLKGVDTQREFFHFIFAGLTIEEWEAGWQYFVSMNRLENNKWVAGMYNKRERWAEAFFREHFFGGICSTQRCEGMNRNLKGGIGRHMRLYEVMPRMEKTIARIRNRIAEDDYKSQHFEPVCGTHMRCLQEEVGRIFTHDIFLLIKDQINYETKFVIVHRDVHPTTGLTLLSVTQYGKPHRLWNVWYNPDDTNPTFDCSCKLFQSDGIPCCHIFAAMKFEMVTSFPNSLVKKRWTKEASVRRTVQHTGSASVSSVQIARYGELMSIAAKICHTASYTDELFSQTREFLFHMNLETQQKRGDDQCKAMPEFVDGLHPNVVRDPIICRTKGTKSKSVKENEIDPGNQMGGPKCTRCGIKGHNRRTCEITKPETGAGAGAGAGSSTINVVDTDSASSSDNGMQNDSETDMQTGNQPCDPDIWPNLSTTSLMHHNEEARPFEFVGGYDNSDSIRTDSMSYARLDSFSFSRPTPRD